MYCTYEPGGWFEVTTSYCTIIPTVTLHNNKPVPAIGWSYFLLITYFFPIYISRAGIVAIT
jgi:hypothetical protein